MRSRHIFVLYLLLQYSFSLRLLAEEPDETEEDTSTNRAQINFASVAAGAVVLEKSKASKGYGNLLNDDRDKYGISPCKEKQWVVIGLSEDILVQMIVMENYEKYSSLLHEFQVLGATTYPTNAWQDYGIYAAQAHLGAQEFNLTTPSWARYLKFKFLSQHGTEFYCTLSQIKVYGSTVLESFKREVEISDLEVLNMKESISFENDKISGPITGGTTSIVGGGGGGVDVLHNGSYIETIVKEQSVENILSSPSSESKTSSGHDFNVHIEATAEQGSSHSGDISTSDTITSTSATTTASTITTSVETTDTLHVSTDEIDAHLNDTVAQQQRQQVSGDNIAFIAKAVDALKQVVVDPILTALSPNSSQLNLTASNTPVEKSSNTINNAMDAVFSADNSSSSNLGVDPLGLKENTVVVNLNVTEELDASLNITLSLELDSAVDSVINVASQSLLEEPVTESSIAVEIVSAPTADTADSSSTEEGDGGSSVSLPDRAQVDTDPISLSHDTTTADPSVTGAPEQVVAAVPPPVVPETVPEVLISTPPVEVQPPPSKEVDEQPPTSPSSAELLAASSTSSATIEEVARKGNELNCLEVLKYPSFKAKILSKITSEPDKASMANQDNVFKLLMQKIKTLETSVAITELYAAQVYECYRLNSFQFTPKDPQTESHAKVEVVLHRLDAMGWLSSNATEIDLANLIAVALGISCFSLLITSAMCCVVLCQTRRRQRGIDTPTPPRSRWSSTSDVPSAQENIISHDDDISTLAYGSS